MKKLFSTTCIPAPAGTDTRRLAGRFVKDEEGNVTFVAITFIAILLTLAGVAWDLNSHEYHRIKVQNTADRAVLAAADLDQTLDPQEVVNDYFDKVGYPDLVANVRVEEGLNFRTVTVETDAVIAADTIAGNFNGSAFTGGRAATDEGPVTQQRAEARAARGLPADAGKSFEEILGEEVDRYREENVREGNYLSLRTLAAAEERVNNVEISMVLDISGSMGEGDKMDNMRNAARTFVDAVLNPSTEDLVSISVVPYSEHVTAGRPLFDQFNVNQVHDFSYCIEFEPSDFNTTVLNDSQRFEQVQHYFHGNSNFNDRSNPVCLRGEHEDIDVFSQDAQALKQKIDRLEPRGNTSIFLGMKWAAGLLDPNFQEINARLANSGHSDSAFANRPVAFNDPATLKTVILMTDGQNTLSRRINPQVYANESHYRHWDRNNFDWWVNRNVHFSQRHLWSSNRYFRVNGDRFLDSICTAAKANNIVIWSIGFEVTTESAEVMRDCASSPSHFFRVEGVEITEAFSAIARQINQLRLTQ